MSRSPSHAHTRSASPAHAAPARAWAASSSRAWTSSPWRVLLRAPAVLSLVLAVIATLALFGSGVGPSHAVERIGEGGVLGAAGEPAPLGASILAAQSTALDEGDDDAEGSEDAAGAEEPEAAEEPEPEEPAATEVFATVEDIELRSPNREAKVHGFHEGAVEALPMTPAGKGTTVLPSRGRNSAPTSAVDVVLVDDTPVVSPVDGRVTAETRYQLYGKTGDRKLVIRPDDAPHLRIVVLHIEGLQVEPGDEVVAGETVVANAARRLPFGSQVDRETAPNAWPHVHLEVVDRG